jgi:hypothetical protein
MPIVASKELKIICLDEGMRGYKNKMYGKN